MLEELSHRFRFSILGDKIVSNVIDRAGADPFTSMGTAGYYDSFTRAGRLLGICRMYTNTESGNVAAFIAEANVEHTDVRWEEGLQKAHPGGDDGERLVVLKEDVGFGGWPKAGTEGTVVIRGLCGGILEGKRGIGIVDGLSEVVH